jgi:3-oxoadipate enol-lactonase
MTDTHDFERGQRNRRRAMGDAFVDRALLQSTTFNADFQRFVTEYAWHGVWSRPGLDGASRRLIVLAMTAALGRWEEFDGHLRGAMTPGHIATLTVDQLREALIQFAIYAGVPCANTAFARATTILRELGHELAPLPAADSFHPGAGRSVFTTSRPKLHASLREPSGGAGGRPTVVLSHALGQDHAMWDDVAAELVAAGWRVLCPDTRGHGRSESVDPGAALTLAELAEDAARLIDQCCDGPVVWVGLSMGGMVGQELALRHPAKLQALVLANTTGRYPEAGRQAMDERMATARSQGLAALADATLDRFFSADFRSRRPAEVARARRQFEATDVDGYLACAAAVREVDTLERLSRLKLPTLVIAGSQDAGTPLPMAEALAAAIPGARLAVLQGCAHLSAAEQPQAFAAALLDWLDAC